MDSERNNYSSDEGSADEYSQQLRVDDELSLSSTSAHNPTSGSASRQPEMDTNITKVLIRCMGEPMCMMGRLDSTKNKQYKMKIYGDILVHLQVHGYTGTNMDTVFKLNFFLTKYTAEMLSHKFTMHK